MDRETIFTIIIYTLIALQLTVAYFAYSEIKSFNEKYKSCADFFEPPNITLPS